MEHVYYVTHTELLMRVIFQFVLNLNVQKTKRSQLKESVKDVNGIKLFQKIN